LREFGRAPVDLVPRDTLYIDLSQSEKSLLSSMKAKGRYNIKLAKKAGVSIKIDYTVECVKRFYSIMTEASIRDQFTVEPHQFFEHLADVLVPEAKATFLFAEHESDTLGTLLLVTYGDRATYLYGGITNWKRNLMGGYLLQWEAMKLAKNAGCSIYDFYGFDPFRSPEHQYARFSQFKSQFGGKVVRFIGAQDYFFLDNVADAFIKVVKETERAKSAPCL
jgi:lipid II:glycine glycyltransferase (peptidoglycan interpeptide bridge formation enzyme)